MCSSEQAGVGRGSAPARLLMMAWWRRSGIVRAMAAALLLWTAADITNSSLCALEQESSVFWAPAADATVAGSTEPSSPLAPDTDVHVDDCFCCSHCVELARLLPDLGSAPARREHRALVLPSPRIFGLQLYHPPLA